MYKIDLKESQKKEVCTSSFASALDQTQHQELYQVMKGSNVSAKVFDDSGNNIPGRSINFREYYGRDTCNTALCNISAAAPRICDKFQKLCFRTNSESRVSGYDCELKDNDIVFTSGKVQKIKSQCLDVYSAQEITLLELTRLLGTLTSTIQVILPARLQ